MDETMPIVRVMIGLDCDRPRGNILKTDEGRKMADAKMLSLERIGRKLDQLEMPRTYFVCGQFLESMVAQFGETRVRLAFSPDSYLSEIADHTYSHSVMKAIPTRPDKVPIHHGRVVEEYKFNTDLFSAIFRQDLRERGLRAPLGHYQGLSSDSQLTATLDACGVLYLSSDLRDRNHSLNPRLLDESGNPRQPYCLTANLVEIPSHGWQDTVFGGQSMTPLFETPPSTYPEILAFYAELFVGAKEVAARTGKEFYLGLVNHPYNICYYDPLDRFFDDLKEVADELGVRFCHYRTARNKIVADDKKL
jgi:hypothetical protein